MTSAIRLEALRCALQFRTPGTTPEQTVAVAQVFLEWLEPPLPKPVTTAPASIRAAPAR